jgi:hypothetical protein
MYSCSHESHIVNIMRFSLFQYLPNDMRACPFIHVWNYCHQSKFSVNTHTATLTQDTPSDNIDDVLLAMVTQHPNRSTRPRSHLGDICSVLSQPTTKTAKAQVQDLEISVNGHTYVRQMQSHDIQYSVSQASRRKKSYLVN